MKVYALGKVYTLELDLLEQVLCLQNSTASLVLCVLPPVPTDSAWLSTLFHAKVNM